MAPADKTQVMNDFIGQTLRSYTIVEKIGVGGYGVVYRARQALVERDVAMKMILPDYADNEQFRKRFITEAKLIARLGHPHIIPLFDYWQDEETGTWMVMRYIRGGTLAQLLEDAHPIPLEFLAKALEQVARALDYAHENGVIHRDMKPANIMLDEKGNAYLGDFGIARLTTDGTNITETGMVVGTPDYMSPEQAQGLPLDGRSDIYSLGIMLFELLTARKPFVSGTQLGVVLQHVNNPPPSVRDFRPDLPKVMDAVIQKAVAKSRDERYATATEMVRAFRNATQIKEETLEDVPPPTVIPMGSGDASMTAPMQQAAAAAARHSANKDREQLLQKVEQFWIQELLNNSLHEVVRRMFALNTGSPMVDMVVRQGDRTLRPLPHATHIAEVFDTGGGELVILGENGSGKTTALLHLARDLMARAQRDSTLPVPVVFHLAAWANGRLPLADWLVHELATRYQLPNYGADIQGTVKTLLPLLDGLDEVRPEARDACVEAINAFRREHGVTPVVCCSLAEYESLAVSLEWRHAVILQPLSSAQVDTYLESAGEAMAGIRKVIHENTGLRRMMTSPLILNLVMAGYRGLTGADIGVMSTPEARVMHLLDSYVGQMLKQPGAEMHCTPEQSRHYLAWLAGYILRQGDRIFDPASLSFRQRLAMGVRGQIPVNYGRFLDAAAARHLLRRAGSGYLFIHRVLLDYFATQPGAAGG